MRIGPFGVALFGVAALCACGTAGSHEILAFFFDGVPDPDAATTVAVAAPEGPPEFVGVPPVTGSARMTVHRPYAEGKCDKCHSSRSGKPIGLSAIFQGVPMLLEPIEKLCFKCHGIEQKAYLHAPAVSGQCSFCHDPHQTPNKRMLLTATTRELCARCHSGATFLTQADHARYGDRECIACHDPHAADIEFNLLPGAKGGEPEPRKPTVSLPTSW